MYTNGMKDRIKLIMEKEQLTPSAFADKLQLGRAVVSHILNGRNNPSLDVVTRILAKMTYINPDWLITGNGNMYKMEENESRIPVNHQAMMSSNFHSSQNEPDLFAQIPTFSSSSLQNDEYRKEIIVEQIKTDDKAVENKQVISPKTQERKVIKIIIYYSDNTFETFNADNKPL